MKVGDRVRIISNTILSYSRYHLIGKEGVIQTLNYLSKDRVGVVVDGVKNCSSNRGVFYLRETDLLVLKEEIEVSKGVLVLKGFNKLAAIKLSLKDGSLREYLYALYDDGVEYKEGDKVLVSGVVNTPVVISQILSVEDPSVENIAITEEVICKLDYSAYEQRVANRKRMRELIQEMDKKIKEMDEINKYEMYAKNNPELASMLEELKSLRG